MTVFYLVRHAHHDRLGKELVGRRPNVFLSEAGRVQAMRLAAMLGDMAFDKVLSSPRERARQTAEPLAARQGRDVELCPALDEIDFGAWTGWSFAELDRDPRWHRFNRWRGSAQVPGGEAMPQVVVRVVELIERLAADHPGEQLILFSHGDVIRAALIHYLGIPADLCHRLEIKPAAPSILALTERGPQLLALNAALGDLMGDAHVGV
jgi:broad specificity phosphatase PhoE